MLVANTALASGTLPLTRRDILPEVESPLLLAANNFPTTSQEHLNERDTKNTHPSMTAGQKRENEIKRSNSYRRATDRLSVQDSAKVREEFKGYFGEDNKRKDDNNLTHASSNVTHKSKKESLFPLRIFSKKSGTDASSDTDDDQSSVRLGRKKKSVFIRLKERLEFAFIKDRNEHNRRGEKQKHSNDLSASDTKKTYRRKSQKKGEERRKTAQDTVSQEDNKSAQPCEPGQYEPTESQSESQHSPGLFRKDNIFKTLRDSFRRKSSPQYLRQGSKDSLRRNSKELHKLENCSPQSSNVATYPRQETDHQSVTNEQDKYLLKSDRDSSEIHALKLEHKPEHNEKEQYKERGMHFNGEPKPSKQCRDNVVEELESTFEGDGNHATELFGAIIDPDSTRQFSLSCQDRTRQSPRSPTKGSSPRKMRPEGLKQRRSRSFENTPSSAVHLNLRSSLQRRSYEITAVADVHKDSLSPEEECDGLQHGGSVLRSRVLRRSQEEEQSELSDAYLDEDDQKKKINNVARRLKIIADQKVEEKKRYATEEEIVIALKEIADEIDRKHGHGFKIPGGIPRELLPVMKDMILAKTYACFAHVIQQEVGKTIGWEQIALYTFLAQSSLQITGVGRDVGRRVRSLAMKYFSCKIRPWVESRPYGWESIHEETDIETDLD